MRRIVYFLKILLPPVQVMDCLNNINISGNTLHSTQLAEGLMEERLHGELIDCTIHLRGSNKTFPCHKSIIAASSSFLEQLVSNTAETSNEKNPLDIPPDIMKKLLDYIYTGEMHVPVHLLMSAAKASNLLGIDELTQSCIKEGEANIKPENVLSMLTFLKLQHGLNLSDYRFEGKCK